MGLKATRNDVWTAMIDDRAGGAADMLESLAKAGVNLEMVFARRTPEQPGKGLMIVGPIKGKKAEQAAMAAGLGKTSAMYGLRIEGGDKAGLGARITRALADAGISFRGLTAHAIGKKFVCNVALDSADDQARAVAALKKVKA